MLGGHHKKCWVPNKIPGCHQNTRCKLKEIQGAHLRCQLATKTQCAQQKKCQVPTKIAGGHQNDTWPQKETLSAQPDECHVNTNRKNGCQPKDHVPTKRNAGYPPRCWVPTKRNAGCLQRC